MTNKEQGKNLKKDKKQKKVGKKMKITKEQMAKELTKMLQQNMGKLTALLEAYGQGQYNHFEKEDWLVLCKFFEEMAQKKQTENYIKNKPNITFYG